MQRAVSRQYVGIDLHRRRSVVVRMNDDGQVLGIDGVLHDPVELSMAITKAGPDPEVALEATQGWYWVVDLLEANGANVHLVHPLGLHWNSRRVKNDIRDSTELAKPAAPGRPARGLHRPAGTTGAARAGALSGQADRPAHLGQGPDPRGAGQRGDPAPSG